MIKGLMNLIRPQHQTISLASPYRDSGPGIKQIRARDAAIRRAEKLESACAMVRAGQLFLRTTTLSVLISGAAVCLPVKNSVEIESEAPPLAQKVLPEKESFDLSLDVVRRRRTMILPY